MAAHGPGLSRGMPAVHNGCGGLLAPILRLPLAQEVWQATGVGCLEMTSEEAFWRSLSGGAFRLEAEWQTIFAILWSLWTHRNEVIFKGCTPSLMLSSTMRGGLRLFGTEVV